MKSMPMPPHKYEPSPDHPSTCLHCGFVRSDCIHKPKPRKLSDPLIRSMRKAYRKSDRYELDRLLSEESKWKRRFTISLNKLAEVRSLINHFALESISKPEDYKVIPPNSEGSK